MKRSRLLVVLVLVVLAAVAWFAISRARRPVTRYRTAAVERGDLTATVSATGSVRPVVQVQVGSQVSGTISELGADYNSRVRARQILAQIDPSSFRTRVVQAEAALARADAALKEARRAYARAQELLKGNFVSQADVDAAESVVEQRNADRQQAAAQLTSARLDLEHTTIRSPIDGVVISRSVDVGQTVAASLQAPELFVIANDLTQMQVETRIDEADIGRIRPGLPVRFTVDAFPDATFDGKVSQVRLEPITEQNVVTYTTVMHTRNDDLRLRPGMTANVTVLLESRVGVLKVPNAALRFRPATGGRATNAGGGMSAIGTASAQTRAGADSSASPRAARGGSRRSAGAGFERGPRAPADGAESSAFRPGTIYRLRDGKPVPVEVLTGITDGSATEIQGESLKVGDLVIIGLDLGGGNRASGQGLQPPPGMGGSMRGRR